MQTSLRARLFSNHLVVLLLGMLLAAALAWRSIEGLYLTTQRENLLAQAELTAEALQAQALPDLPVESYTQTANVLPGIHTRILGGQGAVLIGLTAPNSGDWVQLPAVENAPVTTPEELLRRPEIAQALRGQSATAVRRVATAEGRRVLYAAAPILGREGTISGIVYLAMPLPPGGLPASLVRSLAAAFLAALLLAAVAAALLARRIARPVESVAGAASAVSTGDLDQRVSIESGIRELDALGATFNRMTDNLRRETQVRNAFVADVSHELRTPLTVIKGTVETLQAGALDDLTGRGPLLASMERETDRLIRLVQDLLVLVRAEAGTLSFHLQPVDLARLAVDRCDHLASLASVRGITFHVRCQSALCASALGDPDRLSQVFDNLLDNAVRYSPDGATVTVELRPGDRLWECAVRDRGPGIAADHLPLVFERFYRADPSRDRQRGGAGLGLAIARALIEAQGGRITAECPPEGGTILRFTLPADPDCHETGENLTPS